MVSGSNPPFVLWFLFANVAPKWTVPWLPVPPDRHCVGVCCWWWHRLLPWVPGLMSIIWQSLSHVQMSADIITIISPSPHGQGATWHQYQEREKGIGKCLYKSGSKMKYNGLVKQLTKSLSVVSPPINNCLQNVNFHFKKRICASELAWHKGGLSSENCKSKLSNSL